MNAPDHLLKTPWGDPGADRITVLWLGADSDLLAAAHEHFTTFHVTGITPVLQALQYGLAACVVIDLVTAGVDVRALVASIQEHWPDVCILGITEDADSDTAHLPAELRTVPYGAGVEALADLIESLDGRRRQRITLQEYFTLLERAQHLEGLAQTALSFASGADVQSILGDLHNMGRVAVGADQVAVLLVNANHTALADSLKLGVPENYLALCNAQLRALDPTGRIAYLGDEVLLREHALAAGPDSIRLREAIAGDAESYMRLPLNIEGQLAGFVAFFSRTPGKFGGAHLQLGRLFATQVATAIHNTRQYLRLSSAEALQQTISNVAQLLAEDLALDDVLRRIAEETVAIVEANAAIVLLVEPDRSLTVRAVSNSEQEWLGQSLAPGVGQAGMIALTGRPSIIRDYANWPHANPMIRDQVGHGVVVVGVPLSYRGIVLGVLQAVFERPPQSSMEAVRDVLVTLAPQAATAIAKAQLHETVRHERAQLQAILDHTPAGVVVFAPDGRITRVNAEARRLLNLLEIPTQTLIGRNILHLIDQYLPANAEIRAQFDLNRPVEVSFGSAGEFLVTVAPVQRGDGPIEAYVGMAQNVTALRRLDLMRANLHRVLTHDLGNLIMLARGPLELLDEPDLPPDQRDELRAMLSNSLIRMQDLITDVTSLEMTDSLGEETFAPYNITALVQRALMRNIDSAEANDITLTSQVLNKPDVPLTGHAVLIMQAVDNLISNAIKYTPRGGRVTVTVDVQDDHTVVHVNDTGYGIAPEYQESIFKPFVRITDDERGDIPGTGLGLSLVKAFAETHGGFVTLESTPGEGSTFSLYLPLESLNAPRNLEGTLPRLDLSASIQHREGNGRGRVDHRDIPSGTDAPN